MALSLHDRRKEPHQRSTGTSDPPEPVTGATLLALLTWMLCIILHSARSRTASGARAVGI